VTRTFTVPILLPADPDNDLEAATKQYADSKVPIDRTIATTNPLIGGGVLTDDLVLDIMGFDATNPGMVYAPGSEDGRYLRDDGTWAFPIVAVDDGDWPPASPDPDTLYLHLAP
jgi:hypothetical protein